MLMAETPSEEKRPALRGGLLRGVIAMIVLIPWTVWWASVCLFAGIVKYPPLHRVGVRIWAKGILFLAGTRLDVSYDAPLDTNTQFVFMSNHQSALDIPALIVATGKTHDLRFMAKESLFKIPFLGWALTRNGYVPIKRESARAAAETFQAILKDPTKAGFSYLIFPEGTRSPDGRMQPLKRGTLGLSLRLGMPVVPLTIIDACRANPKDSYTLRSGTVRVKYHVPVAIPEDGADRAFRDKLQQQVFEAIRAPLPEEQQPPASQPAPEPSEQEA
jgi:1-acyl-sn-glycerol-3-phosphate acyltransferase